MPMFSFKERGFSLSEILIVVVIISIFSAVAIVSYSGFHNYLQVRNASQEVLSMLSTARAMAINQNGYFRVGFNIDTGSFWIDEVDSFGRIIQPKIVHPKSLQSLVKIVTIIVADTPYVQGFVYINFYPSATAQYSKIYLRRIHSPDVDENYYTIIVFPGTGRARLYPNQRK